MLLPTHFAYIVNIIICMFLISDVPTNFLSMQLSKVKGFLYITEAEDYNEKSLR